MPVDFLQIRKQIKKVAAAAPHEAERLMQLQQEAGKLLNSNATNLEGLRDKAKLAASQDQFLRCALPVNEPLNSAYSLPAMPPSATLLAADGSQINPDRHAALNFYLVNVGTISMRIGSSQAPETSIHTSLHVNEYGLEGSMTDTLVGLERDTRERAIMADLAQNADAPVFTLTDGPLELWGVKGQSAEESKSFTKSLEEYQQALNTLAGLGAAASGYVDKPRAALVVQLLEIAAAHRDELKDIRVNRPLRGVTDTSLFMRMLKPGERSAIFAIQSRSAAEYKGDLALHFFYLNVGSKHKSWLARVEIPAWVVNNPEMLNHLHAVLVDQCNILGTRAYPYLLHRAHEVALVTRDEKEQIISMLTSELQKLDLDIGEISQKQAVKNLIGRRRFSLGSKRP